ncbi:MAG: YvcK family protein [Microcystis panniformis Mp_MB_F_20051200_S9]|uniref:Putative gluconeogenesis factor n=1 Tax=Microcystis panniformis Mp_MB_F_20051200_S9 TaxID=2486223 RepID=A0A552Q3X0_9CHRO|nr:MAG: YvcK family protein [Microcystis panniformis Mp_MB_F_20080800_S26D]TRV52121.1 MAG: YvcK family protein [Microcystis panniformis Mp_GB_SS_20050300_S99D]TRV53275.1 MAG: YvcK family protein [Microcystis panniformis Mp_GB_SS_20050300_S99]TRV61416.1 MAG: YvcK family protein [Microcystis panniformis Mp_MB_F_20051200_S9D]TRV62450.1 MAG: YvcK family protein [Microcystis panniformis Mp_MB_F_20080800_S26]TRV63914.1 MAG: YvcK family protein [Microcystis panniformis Mp_MB_F_20051200_S9]TRV70166.1
MSPFKQTLRELNAQKGKIAASVGRKTPKRVNRWFKWLSPGLFVKRWLLISLTGVFLTSFGLAIWVKLTPVNRFLEFVSQALETTARLVPNSVSGPLAVLLGVFLLFWGQSRTVETITEALQPDASEELVDRLRTHRRLHRGPKIVAIGGGTGLSTLLRGLKQYSSNITAIVTVADDGGSSGRLRREMGILPPGDIRNCIAALADEEKLLTELFQYRFHAGDGLSGHSFGNLFISAMTEITGDLEQAIDASAKVLAIRGKVLPATLTDVSLWAKLADGRIIEGESKITEAMGQIREIGCHPADPVALPAALAAIKEADYIIIGPGSLYTSIIPNLLVPAIRQALAEVTVPRVYVCNIMTQPGETDNYSVADHLRAIEEVCEERVFDAVLAQRTAPSPQSLQLYAQEHSHPVFLDREEVGKMGYRIVLANVMAEDEVTAKVRHDPQRLARVLWRWYAKK